MIYVGDCIEVMRAMEPNSVDAVVTDPPYALTGHRWDSLGQGGSPKQTPHVKGRGGFMGRQWDAPGGGTPPGFQAWCEAWGREALRVTKPGGYLLAFGGTRTHHRLVCGLEDAGWIIRDELDWIYASGFPKGRANLKPAHEPIVLARKPGPLRPLNIEETRIGTSKDVPASPAKAHPGFEGKSFAMPDRSRDEAGFDPNMGRWPSNVLLSDPELFDDPNPYVVGSGATTTTRGPVESGEAYEHMFGITPQGLSLTGYGDTGGYSRFFKVPSHGERQPKCPTCGGPPDDVWDNVWSCCGEPIWAADHPTAFIVPKADRRDREPIITPDGHDRSKRFSTHPTQKPTDLMRHLIRLVTPPGGTILDPFLGSGSTAIAAELEGFPWIGIEKEPEYVAIAEARLNGTQRGLGLDTPLVGKPRHVPTDEKLAELGKTYPRRGWMPDLPRGEPDEEPAA